MPDGPAYVIDTSALIDLADRYPRDVFATLWEKIEELVHEGRMFAPQEVRRELEKKSDDLLAWAKGLESFFISDEETVALARKAAEIDRKYPDLKKGKRRSIPNPRSADPWVVALAIQKGARAITQESPQPKAQSIRTIPDACRKEGVVPLTLTELFQELELRF